MFFLIKKQILDKNFSALQAVENVQRRSVQILYIASCNSRIVTVSNYLIFHFTYLFIIIIIITIYIVLFLLLLLGIVLYN